MNNKAESILSQIRAKYPFYGSMEKILGEALDRVFKYGDDNWSESYLALPPIESLESQVADILVSSNMSESAKNNYKLAILTRIRDFYLTFARKV